MYTNYNEVSAHTNYNKVSAPPVLSLIDIEFRDVAEESCHLCCNLPNIHSSPSSAAKVALNVKVVVFLPFSTAFSCFDDISNCSH